MKKNLYITIVGQSMTGKSRLMKLFRESMKQYDIEVQPIWSQDGEPGQPSTLDDHDKRCLTAIAKKTKVVMTEHQANRRSGGTEVEHLNDLAVYVVHDVRQGYGVRFMVMGQPLEKWFGEFPASKERARSIAARLSAELDLDVIDTIPREYDWVQPQ